MVRDKKSMNMIKLCIYFHTSGGKIKLTPKVAVEEGKVQMPTNHKHGIRASDGGDIYFGGSQGKLIDAIKRCLKANKIKFVHPKKQSEYKKFQEMKEKQDFYDEEMNI